MSTYCHRIVEYLNKENKWVRCGETVDNFHGFDQWNNADYYDRGFPADSTIKKDDLKSDDGGFYVWGLSYITLKELSYWCDREKEKMYSYIFSELNQGAFKEIMRKLDMVARGDAVGDGEKKDMQEPCDDGGDEVGIITNFSYFKEICEEATETALMLNDELVRSYALADQVASKEEDYWADYDKIRIVFYYD